MSEKFYVGRDIVTFSDNGKSKPISRVTLLLDDEVSLTAGDDTGSELVASCRYGTQEMADNLLARFSGYEYRAYEAGEADIDPAAELGDGVTVNGIYGLIAHVFDHGDGYPSLSAPGRAEMEDEFPMEGPVTKEFNRKIAQTYSLISKTASEIRTEVVSLNKTLEDNVNAKFSEYSTTIQTAELIGTEVRSYLYVKDENGNITEQEKYSTTEQTAEAITAAINGLDGEYLRVGIFADGMFVEDENGQYTKLTGSYIETDSLKVKAANVSGMLTAAQVQLKGDLTVYDAANNVGGYLGYTPSSLDGSAAIHMAKSSEKGSAEVTVSNYAAKIAYQRTEVINGIPHTVYDQVYVGPNTDTGLGVIVLSSGQDAIRFQHNTSRTRGFYPSHSEINLGLATLPWNVIYSKDGTVQPSDANLKNSIEELPEKYLDLFDGLSPVRFKLNEGTSGRYHIGFISQEVEEAMSAANVDSMEFAGFVKDKDEDGNDIYLLRYNEFIGILTSKIKQLEGRIKDLEG